MQRIITLALAAGAAALPAATSKTPLSNSEFGLIMDVSTTDSPIYVSLNGVKNGTSEDLILIGERLSVYPGTPTYLDPVSPDPDCQALNFDVDGCEYGLYAPDIGDNYGIKTYVTAKKDEKQYAWSVYNGQVHHKLYAATNQFLACNTTYNGETYLALGWGIADSNGLPEGCMSTRVFQNCNIEGSEANCKST
ncbi:uncharacterized protein MYCFIDRAFT_195371 [Pseudocercospora fijiensis CIRAD86]|uniref:Uncharacterized protein n=1 Tax=Pseudocercospora fijiensis (strain CIRAD86) TaxID=383855 RepID=M3B4K1_PSEFD|nr:uncharacterized protein MYCFIDRAFT_195371 [Pseudocercospora fijiensis CIRAD86]EME84272.1 hypothetical protein MYCFIDRAFT_195371 [Pseudocercospora fijiensis CIRAD86]